MDSTRRLLLLGTAGSAVLFFFGTGLTPVPGLVWLAPLPILLVARRVPAWHGAFVACFLGCTNSWAWSSGSHDLPLWPWGLLVSFAFGVTFALAVWLYRFRFGVLVAPAAWVSVLYLASVFNPTGIVGTLATTQGDMPLLLQVTSVLGPWGLEYLIFLAPSLLAARQFIALGTLAAVVLGGSALRLSGSGVGSERVALVASNQKGWAADLRTDRSLLNAYLAELNALPADVTTVVLPEAAFGSAEQFPEALEPMRQLAQARGFTIVVGYAQWTGSAKYNYALVLPSGSAYLKHHDLVSPAGDKLVFAKPGVGIEICGDVNLPEPSRSYAAAGARLLAIPASDENANGWQHSRTALLRGVENGTAIAWGGRQTELMIADGWGRVLAAKPTSGSDPSTFTTAVADVPLGPGPTLYTRLGDWFVWLCLAASAASLGWIAWSRGQQRVSGRTSSSQKS